MHLEKEFLLLWEMSLLQLPIPHPTGTAPGSAAPLDSTGMPSILPPCLGKAVPTPLVFIFYSHFFSPHTLKAELQPGRVLSG